MLIFVYVYQVKENALKYDFYPSWVCYWIICPIKSISLSIQFKNGIEYQILWKCKSCVLRALALTLTLKRMVDGLKIPPLKKNWVICFYCCWRGFQIDEGYSIFKLKLAGTTPNSTVMEFKVTKIIIYGKKVSIRTSLQG